VIGMHDDERPPGRKADLHEISVGPPAVHDEPDRIAPDRGENAERRPKGRARGLPRSGGTTGGRAGRNRGRHPIPPLPPPFTFRARGSIGGSGEGLPPADRPTFGSTAICSTTSRFRRAAARFLARRVDRSKRLSPTYGLQSTDYGLRGRPAPVGTVERARTTAGHDVWLRPQGRAMDGPPRIELPRRIGVSLAPWRT
jgi:hypothetical protein